MKGLFLGMALVFGLTVVPFAHAEMVSGNLIDAGASFLIVKDKDGNEHRLHFDRNTTITILNQGKETRAEKRVIRVGFEVLAFEDDGYAIYLQMICGGAESVSSC